MQSALSVVRLGVCFVLCVFFFFKQKTAYEMCGRDWSSDVCSSDLSVLNVLAAAKTASAIRFGS